MPDKSNGALLLAEGWIDRRAVCGASSASSRGKMGIRGAVDQIAALPANDMGERDPFGATVTPTFVVDKDWRSRPARRSSLRKKRSAANGRV